MDVTPAKQQWLLLGAAWPVDVLGAELEAKQSRRNQIAHKFRFRRLNTRARMCESLSKAGTGLPELPLLREIKVQLHRKAWQPYD